MITRIFSVLIAAVLILAVMIAAMEAMDCCTGEKKSKPVPPSAKVEQPVKQSEPETPEKQSS